MGYILEVKSRHLSRIYLPVWNDWMMLSLTIYLVPSTNRTQESRLTCLKPLSLEILRILFWNSFCRIDVPSACFSSNLGALANSSEANRLVRYERLPWNEQMNSKPGICCMKSEFGRITLATLSILYEIQDSGVRCAII